MSATLLALVLLLAQTVLAAHGIEHLAAGDEPECEICLMASGAGAGLPAPPVAVSTLIPRAAPTPDTRPAATPFSRTYRPQSPRAPPAPAPIAR